jgi:DNA-binding XRE family transcriptional regulator
MHKQDLSYDYRRIVGAYVREHRERMEMTQAQLAKHLGMGNTMLSAIEVGRNTVPPDCYFILADLFGLSCAEFGNFLLRFSNPLLFAMIYGEHTADLKADLAKITKQPR